MRIGATRILATAAIMSAALVQPAGAGAAPTVLGPGSTGPKVVKLHERLGALSYLPVGFDARRFTARTLHAVIAFQMHEGLAVDGLVGLETRKALEAAKRPRPLRKGQGRRIEVWRGRQLAVLVRRNRVVRTVHVSTGAAGFATPAGRFAVFRREKLSWSLPYEMWLPWAAYFNRGIALHGHASVPTYPASHGCVRVPTPFARAVYRFAKLGTRVDVVA